jgi:hypothetical protein
MGLGRKLGQTLVVQRWGHGCEHLQGNSLSEQRAVSIWIAITAALAVVGIIALYLSLSR